MACKYILKGKVYDSEDALNDELLLNNKLSTKYGDIVFDRHTQNYYKDKIDDNQKLVKELKEKGYVTYESDINEGEHADLDGVKVTQKGKLATTQFIHKLIYVENGEVHHVFPEFDFDNYWQNRKKDLANAVQLYKDRSVRNNNYIISDYDIPVYFNECDSSNPNAVEVDGKYYELKNITEPAELEIIKNRLIGTDDKLGIWKQQGEAGTAIHAVFEQFFKSERYRYPNERDKIINNIKKNLKEKELKYLTPKSIEQIVDQAYTFQESLKRQFGENAYIIPERDLTGRGIVGNEGYDVIGKLDMIVITEDGSVHVVDYKCSQKNWNDYNPAKKNTFNYQLNTYARILKRLGINQEIQAWVVPIKMENFKIDKTNDTISFENISMLPTHLELLPKLERTDEILDEVFPEDSLMDLSTNEVSTVVENFTKKAFPQYYDYKWKEKDDEEIAKIIEQQGGYQKEGNDVVVNLYGKNRIVGSSDIEVFQLVKKYFKTHNPQTRTAHRTQAFRQALKDGIRQGTFSMQLNTKARLGNGEKKGSRLWLQTYFQKYANKRYEVIDTPEILDAYGVVLVKNIETNVIDILKISQDSYNLKHKLTLGNKSRPQKYILGTFQSDTLSYNSADSPVLEATEGNIELMETMAIVNCFENLFNKGQNTIGEIGVLNPDAQDYLSAPNKQLLYNFSRLSAFTKIPNNFAYDKNTENKIHMMSYTQKVQAQLKDIYKQALSGSTNHIHGLKSFLSSDYIDKFSEGIIDKQFLLAELNKLRLEIENQDEYSYLKNISSVQQQNFEEHPEIPLYNNILYAISELNGINLNQQISDHDNWLESSFKSILIEGVNGNYTDNPGTLKSATLNKLANLTETAYQNARVEVQQYQNQLREEIDALKESKNFGWIKKVTYGNQTNLYLKLYSTLPENKNDLVFKNPFDPEEIKDLSSEEIKFLKSTLTDLLNQRRGFNITDDNSLEEAIELNDDALLVPLIKATSGSQNAVGGWFHAWKARLKKFSSWAKIKAEVISDIEGFLKTDEKDSIASGEYYEMVNRIENSYNPSRRAELLNLYSEKDADGNIIRDLSMWEHNLERIRLQSKVASSMKSNLDRIFPMLKTIVMHLNFQGIIQNDKFENDMQYALDYIKNKIFNMPLEDVNKWGAFKVLSGQVMSEMSKLSLAFNVKSLYQCIDGFWKDIMLVIQKPDGGQSFTKKNMKDSFFWIVQDLKHRGDKPTLGEYLNQQFGINDQDTNGLADKISNDNAGLQNFWSLGFRFASRPDYYNRMTIFGAQMRADGVFEAFDQDSKGNWKYNIKKDKRFQHFLNKEINHPDYNKEKALFLTMAEEFINEKAQNPDGTLYVLDMDKPNLPRAYTTKQSESMKAIGDKIYGYYSHEKKSMMQAYTLGALFWQMNTFWSSKKNQYLSGRTFTQQGDFVQYEEPAVDEEGNIKMDEQGQPIMNKFFSREDKDGNIIPVAESELKEGEPRLPYMVWKGRPQEGIIVSLFQLGRDMLLNDEGKLEINSKKVVQILNPNSDYWNSLDPEVRNLYNANLRQLFYDLLMFILIGCLVSPSLLKGAKDYAKEIGNDTIEKAFFNNCTITLASMLQQSADDFNACKSITERGRSWTPFSISKFSKLIENYGNALGGSQDLYDATVKSVGAFSNSRPIMDWVKLNTFGVNIGTNMNKE